MLEVYREFEAKILEIRVVEINTPIPANSPGFPGSFQVFH